MGRWHTRASFGKRTKSRSSDHPLYYRVFIKYCVRRFLIYSGLLLSLLFLGFRVCTHTRQVEHQRCSRTELRTISKFSGKNTIINELHWKKARWSFVFRHIPYPLKRILHTENINIVKLQDSVQKLNYFLKHLNFFLYTNIQEMKSLCWMIWLFSKFQIMYICL